MCGRFRVPRSDKWAIARKFGVRIDDVPDYTDGLRKLEMEECSPGTMQLVVCVKHRERELSEMRWGFPMTIQGKKKTVFNTKSENVMTSPLWRKRFTENRCIVPASCFIERPAKVKTEIRIKGQDLLGFAALWGLWTNPNTHQVEPTFSIFTTEPNATMQTIHSRQPVILDPSEYDEWLEAAERPPVHLLRVFPQERTVVTPLDPAPLTLFDAKAEPYL
jgi:putative SOS response-associated peptidase YedK